MRLIGEPRSSGNFGECLNPAGDQSEGTLRARFGTAGEVANTIPNPRESVDPTPSSPALWVPVPLVKLGELLAQEISR